MRDMYHRHVRIHRHLRTRFRVDGRQFLDFLTHSSSFAKGSCKGRQGRCSGQHLPSRRCAMPVFQYWVADHTSLTCVFCRPIYSGRLRTPFKTAFDAPAGVTREEILLRCLPSRVDARIIQKYLPSLLCLPTTARFSMPWYDVFTAERSNRQHV